MRVFFFLYSLSGGGAERVTANLANFWSQKGFSVGVITLCDVENDCYPLLPNIARRPLRLAGNSPTVAAALYNNLRRAAALRQVLRQERPDVVVAMGSPANVLLALSSFGLSRGVYIGSERIHPPRRPIGRFWEVQRRYFYRWLTAIVVQTEQARQWVQQNTLARQVEVIPNPVQYPLPPSQPPLPVWDIVPPHHRILLAVGRLEHQKGFDLLLKAFATVHHAHPSWHLAILGEGSMRPQLEQLREQLGLKGQVSLPGRAGNIAEWYEQGHLFVLSSRYEGFPNVVLEAMAYGVPSVCFDCETGPSEVVRHGIDGILVPAENVEALASAIDSLMRDEQTRLSLAQRAVEVRERFGMRKIAAQWEEVFQRYLTATAMQRPVTWAEGSH